MPYQCSVGPGQQIYLDNLGDQTLITVASQGGGQEQQASSSVTTGPWTALPQVAQTQGGVVIRCTTAQGTITLQVQGTQMSTMTGTVNWATMQPLPLQTVATMPGAAPMPPMTPMAPMPPMQPGELHMGDMHMSTKPMTMRMGDMTLQMGNGPTPSARQFCTQCGAPVTAEDKFCGHCGHQLQR